MNTQIDKTQQNKSQSVAHGMTQKQSRGKSSYPFIDNRPEAIAQRRMQEVIKNSPLAMPLKVIQEMANNQKTEVSQNQSSSVIQAKKTAPFDLDRNTVARVLKYSEYKNKDAVAYKQYVYTALGRIYTEKLVSGTRYWNSLQDAITKYNGPGKETFIKAQKEKRTDFDKKFLKNYVSRVKGTDNKEIEVSSSGLGPGESEAKSGGNVPYSNSVSFDDNSIIAKHNYAGDDKARIEDKRNEGNDEYENLGLPNSEILWQQYKLAAQKYAKNDSAANKLIKNLNVIKRRQVQPPGTLGTILFALPDGKQDLTASHTWAPGSEEFLALLGTVNCSGAAHLLTDHVDELDGKSITEIELLGGEDVNIDIKLSKKEHAKKLGLTAGALAVGGAYMLGGFALGPALGIGLLAGLGAFGGAKLLGY